MTKVNNRFVMPIPAGRGAQGNLHQHHRQNLPPENNQETSGNGGSLFEPSTFKPASPIGKNLYLDARWGVEKAKINTPVKIIAQLNSPLTETVTINIFQKVSGQLLPITTFKADMNYGRVETIWQAQNPNNNYNEGYYFFMIFGGRANYESMNHLVLS